MRRLGSKAMNAVRPGEMANADVGAADLIGAGDGQALRKVSRQAATGARPTANG